MVAVSLSWMAPFNGANVAGYRIKYGETTGGPYTSVKDVGNALSAVVDNLPDDRPTFFVVVAYNRFGQESVVSNEVTDNVAPDQPNSLKIERVEVG